MDLLKKELERKKNALKAAQQSTGGAKRFIKASELRRIQEEQEEKDRLQKINTLTPQTGKRKFTKKNDHDVNSPSKKEKKSDIHNALDTTESGGDKDVNASKPRAATLKVDDTTYTPVELTNQLRNMGLPVRLFGEHDETLRLARLHKALAAQKVQLESLVEQNEFRLGQGHGIKNTFLSKIDQAQVKKDAELKAANAGNTKATDESKPAQQLDDNDDDDTTNDDHKRIHKYLKGLLKQWEDDLVQRSEEEKRSVAGRNETKTLKQCKDYIRPLFKQCKRRQLEPGLTNQLVKIVDFCQQGEFVRAHDAYIDIAIGRAAWPIGVTMVGIHARSGRAKIETSNVAHVMNSELQRKYLTSVKRLLTFAQKKSSVNPSKKVMN
jgi:pre-mRNA-splicing factor 18